MSQGALHCIYRLAVASYVGQEIHIRQVLGQCLRIWTCMQIHILLYLHTYAHTVSYRGSDAGSRGMRACQKAKTPPTVKAAERPASSVASAQRPRRHRGHIRHRACRTWIFFVLILLFYLLARIYQPNKVQACCTTTHQVSRDGGSGGRREGRKEEREGDNSRSYSQVFVGGSRFVLLQG